MSKHGGDPPVALMALLVQTLSFVNAGTCRRQTVEHDVEDQAHTVLGAVRRQLADGFFGRCAQAQLGVRGLEIRNQEGITIGREDGRRADMIESERSGLVDESSQSAVPSP